MHSCYVIDLLFIDFEYGGLYVYYNYVVYYTILYSLLQRCIKALYMHNTFWCMHAFKQLKCAIVRYNSF